MSVHVFTAPWQPATLVVDAMMGEPMIFEAAPRALIRCHKCNRRRWAEHVEVQVYYDKTDARCKAGHGCRKKESPHARR